MSLLASRAFSLAMVSPTRTADTTNSTDPAFDAVENSQREQTSTLSVASSPAPTISGMPNFIGTATSASNRAVAVGVACAIVVVFLLVMACAMMRNVHGGKGKYDRNHKDKGNNVNGFRLQPVPPRHHHQQHPSPLRREVWDEEAAPSIERQPQRQDSGSLEDKLMRAIHVVRNWRV